jgi:hypothetical protein
VAVSCVSIQVFTRSTPVFQSLFPVSESSPTGGGTETGWTRGPVLVAPSISEPPRKHTRWSCLGASRHELIETDSVRGKRKVIEYVHLSIGVLFRYQLSRVSHFCIHALLDEVFVNSTHSIVIHLSFQSFGRVISLKDMATYSTIDSF